VASFHPVAVTYHVKSGLLGPVVSFFHSFIQIGIIVHSPQGRGVAIPPVPSPGRYRCSSVAQHATAQASCPATGYSSPLGLAWVFTPRPGSSFLRRSTPRSSLEHNGIIGFPLFRHSHSVLCLHFVSPGELSCRIKQSWACGACCRGCDPCPCPCGSRHATPSSRRLHAERNRRRGIPRHRF